jgi:hypothetical protein
MFTAGGGETLPLLFVAQRQRVRRRGQGRGMLHRPLARAVRGAPLGTGFLIAIAAMAVLGFFLIFLERLRALERRVDTLTQQLAQPEPQKPADAAPLPPSAPLQHVQPAPAEQAAPTSQPADAGGTPEVNTPPQRSRWGRAERSFARFWTGILGALALVVGFSFLAVLTALRLDKFARFLMLVAVSGLLYGGAVLAQRRGRTRLLGSWLRSAAGALALFGCFASSAVPWLRWVTSDVQGYAILAAGIAVNLAFALLRSRELFASFHTLISLAALAVAPAQALVLLVAVVVTGACSLPAFRKPWGVHLLLCTSSFFAFFVAWMMRQTSATYAIESMAIGGLVLALGPAFAAPYVSRANTAFGAAARGATWIYLAAGVLLFSHRLPWISGLLLVLALAAYILSRTAGARGPAWLARLDGLASIGLAVLAALGLVRVELDLVFVFAIAYGATVLMAADRGADPLVRRVCGVLQTALGLAVIAVALASVLGARLPGHLLTAGRIQVAVVVGALAVTTAVQLRFTPDLPTWVNALVGCLYPAFLVALYAIGLTLNGAWRWAALGGLVVAAGGAAALVLDRRAPEPSHRIGLMAAAAVVHLASLIAFREISAMSLASRVGHGLLLTAVAFVALAAAWGPDEGRRLRAYPGALLVTVALAFAALSTTLTVDRAWTWIAWAAIVGGTRLVLPRAPRWLSGPSAVAGIGLAVVAGIATAAVRGSAPALRLASEAATAAAMFAWTREANGERRVLSGVPLAGLALLAFYVYLEARGDWAAVALAAVAVAALAAGVYGPAALRSLSTYSVFAYAASLVSLAWFTGPAARSDLVIFSLAWWAGVVSSLAALGYVALYYMLADRRAPRPADTTAAPAPEDPGEPPWLRGLREAVSGARNHALFGPFYLAIGLFFAWSFDGPALTAIYIVTCFTVFALGIALKEPVFRPLSYGLLAYCLVRLVFFDMQRADTFDRALVFIVAGAVLLGMNWLYNRFVGEDEGEGTGTAD